MGPFGDSTRADFCIDTGCWVLRILTTRISATGEDDAALEAALLERVPSSEAAAFPDNSPSAFSLRRGPQGRRRREQSIPVAKGCVTRLSLSAFNEQDHTYANNYGSRLFVCLRGLRDIQVQPLSAQKIPHSTLVEQLPELTRAWAGRSRHLP